MKAPLTAMLPVLLLAACSSPARPAPIDMGPVGDGLSVIGYALIGMAVVITIGRFLNKEP